MWIKSLAICLTLALWIGNNEIEAGFVKTQGTKFVKDGKPFYFNGFNAYWLMTLASDPSTRPKVTDVFSEASRYGLSVARTWAFSDGGGGNRALQTSPGNYNEDVFKGLDFVVAEAEKFKISLILVLVNNWSDYGGKKQYVQWATNQGHNLNSEDAFFSDPIVKGFYKNHIKAVLTRVNTITRIAYKDDPTIFAWELMNELQCKSDLSGKTVQEWVTEVSANLKSIDPNHLLEIGLEGFYGTPKKSLNPAGNEVGTDFISNNQIAGVDFATIHIYPDQWLPNNPDGAAQAQFAKKWIEDHITDSNTVLKKPLLVSEFGFSTKTKDFSIGLRDKYYTDIFQSVYDCARTGPCGGGLFWQLLDQGMDNMNDSYQVVFQQSPSTAAIILEQSRRIDSLHG